MFIGFREKGRGWGERDMRNIDWLLPVSALTRDRTHSLSVYGMMLQLSHRARAMSVFFFFFFRVIILNLKQLPMNFLYCFTKTKYTILYFEWIFLHLWFCNIISYLENMSHACLPNDDTLPYTILTMHTHNITTDLNK